MPRLRGSPRPLQAPPAKGAEPRPKDKPRHGQGGVTLAWPGRAWSCGAAGSSAAMARAVPIEIAGDGAHRLIFGDALAVAGALANEGLTKKIDLVYVDPPFASQADYVLEARLDGPANGRVRRSVAYGDDWSSVAEYLDMLAPRLEAAVALLAPTGTIWVHLDWRAAYLVRVVLDEVLGRDRFINEIVWRRAPNLGRQAASAQFGRTLDTLVVYGASAQAKLRPPTRLEPIEPSAIRWDNSAEKGGRPFTTAPRGDYTDASIARLEAEGRVHRTASGRCYVKYFLVKDAAGAWCRERRVDALWTDVPPLRHVAQSERTGYPTQKPRALLERVIACASPPGGLVVDLFAGSGTTAEAAHATGRRSILGDVGAASMATARARLLRAGAGVSVERCGAGIWPEAPAPEIAVSSAGEGRMRVTLVEPREPLAWCIDPSYSTQGSFQSAWHSERVPGARPVPCAREAILEHSALPIGVRVFADDGAMVTAIALASQSGALDAQAGIAE